MTTAPDGDGIRNLLLAKASADEFALLRPHVDYVFLEHAEPLILPFEPLPYVYFPVSALASLVTVLEDGSTVEAGSVGREGFVGVPILLRAESTPMQTVTQIAGHSYRIPADVFRDVLARRGPFYNLLIRYVHSLFVIASQSAACNRKHQVEARMARWLLMSGDGVGSDSFALTHDYLAAMLGVRRSGVTEAALKLQEGGLIDYRRGGVRILDRDALESVACECYGVVRDEYAAVMEE